MRTLLPSIVVGLGALLLGPAAALACSCAPPPEPSVALEASDVVFSGTVVGVPPAPAENAPQGVGPVEYRFNVAQSWKGEPGMEVRVLTNSSGAACGRKYTKGGTYLIYASMRDNAIHDSLCSRTRTLESATDDLAVLGEGAVPVSRGGAGRPGPPPSEDSTPGQVPTDSGPAGTVDPGDAAATGGDTGSEAAAPAADTMPSEQVDPEKAEAAAEPKETAEKPMDPPPEEEEEKGGPRENCSLSSADVSNSFGLVLLTCVIVGFRRRIGI